MDIIEDEAATFGLSDLEKVADKLLLMQEMDKNMMVMFSTRRLPIEQTIWWPYSRARRIQLSELRQRHCWYPGVKYKKRRVIKRIPPYMDLPLIISHDYKVQGPCRIYGLGWGAK